MRRITMLLCLALVALVLLPAVAAATPSYDQAVDRLIARGYPQMIESDLCAMGTNPIWGHRYGGSLSDDQAAAYLAKKLRACGFKNVCLEPVPLDVTEFRDAYVTYDDCKVPASTFGGVPPTPCGGITEEVVYVGFGEADNYEGKDVEGKIVLIDKHFSSYWVNIPAAEATLRGAAGVIFTHSELDPFRYNFISQDAIGTFDGYYDTAWVPCVYMSWRDGDALKARLRECPVTATMVNDLDLDMAEDGGVGYNVIGELPGKSCDGQILLYAAHHDAYFRAGMDDTGACTGVMLSAKAMRTSGFKPQHTIVVLFTTGEEYGHTNSYYEWLIGAWYAATHTHADWSGRIRLMLNWESMAMADVPVAVRTTPELAPYLESTKASLPYGANVSYPVHSWNDQWPFAAMGAPTATISAVGGDYGTRYHTQHDTQEIMDYEHLGAISKWAHRVTKDFDCGLLPYDLVERADHLASKVDADELIGAGADPAVVERLGDDVSAFQAAAEAFAAASIPENRIGKVNAKLLKIEKIIHQNFCALNVWEGTIYPHEQVRDNVLGLNAALAALAVPDEELALATIEGIGWNYLGVLFSPETYAWELSRHDADYDRLYWASMGQLARFLNLMPEYGMVEDGDYTAAIASLSDIRNEELEDLNARLLKVAQVLETVTPKIDSLH